MVLINCCSTDFYDHSTSQLQPTISGATNGRFSNPDGIKFPTIQFVNRNLTSENTGVLRTPDRKKALLLKSTHNIEKCFPFSRKPRLVPLVSASVVQRQPVATRKFACGI